MEHSKFSRSLGNCCISWFRNPATASCRIRPFNAKPLFHPNTWIARPSTILAGQSPEHRILSAHFLQQFQKLNIWRNRGKRAPHKPLLALWAIGRCIGGEPRLAPYKLVDRELRRLLLLFGPHRSVIRTDYPFWHMQNDDVWEIDRPELVRTTSKKSAWVRDLKRHAIEGGLIPAVYNALRSDTGLALRIAESLVINHFPPTLHDAVLLAAGIPTQVATDDPMVRDQEFVVSRRLYRDPTFRPRVLNAYGYRCAVCEFAIRLKDTPLALEAAHIRWHEAMGPPFIENGLALCVLHHKLFDAGAFTVLPDLKVLVARAAHGHGVAAALGQYHNEPLRAPPLRGFPKPRPAFLTWHATEVFREPPTVP